MPVLIFVFLTALLVGVPVFIALAGSSLIYTHFIAGIPDFIILHRMASGLDSFPLLAVPFFILAGNLMKPGPLRTTLFALVDFVTLGFMGLLAYFSISITERMHTQTMTVFDLPMSLVYGGVAFGCFLMVIRQAVTVWTHARQGWRRADDYIHQIPAD